jgi:hypothetical protein
MIRKWSATGTLPVSRAWRSKRRVADGFAVESTAPDHVKGGAKTCLKAELAKGPWFGLRAIRRRCARSLPPAVVSPGSVASLIDKRSRSAPRRPGCQRPQTTEGKGLPRATQSGRIFIIRIFVRLQSAACGSPRRRAYRPHRRCGRVAEGGGLLNRYRVVKPYRGFESLRLRQPHDDDGRAVRPPPPSAPI